MRTSGKSEGSARIKGYPEQLGGHCGSGAMRDLLTWAGLDWGSPLSEGLVFGLGGALTFMYLRVPDLGTPIYLVGRNADFEANVCSRLGITTSRKQTDDPGLAWRWVTHQLDQGQPVMLNADIAFLPYLRVRLSNTRHDIVVIGYDENAGTVTVVDNDRLDPQVLSIDDLDRARSSTGFPDPVRYATWPMRFPSELPDLETAARSAAQESARGMREGAGQSLDPLARPGSSVTGSGLPGLDTLATDLRSWPQTMDEESLAQSRQALAVFIEKAGTGGGLFRRLQAQFCKDAASLLDSEAFALAGRSWTDAARVWSELAAAASNDSIPQSDLADLANELVNIERSACGDLERAATSRWHGDVRIDR